MFDLADCRMDPVGVGRSTLLLSVDGEEVQPGLSWRPISSTVCYFLIYWIRWSFSEVLRATGADFGLMHDFFPRRARNELKNKYNREERTNWERLKEVREIPLE